MERTSISLNLRRSVAMKVSWSSARGILQVVLILSLLLTAGYTTQRTVSTLSQSEVVIVQLTQDDSVLLATEYLQKEVSLVRVVQYNMPNAEKLLQRSASHIVVIGHGDAAGVKTNSGKLSWLEYASFVNELKSPNIVLLHCNSNAITPYTSQPVFGFDGDIDARIGALIASMTIRASEWGYNYKNTVKEIIDLATAINQGLIMSVPLGNPLMFALDAENGVGLYQNEFFTHVLGLIMWVGGLLLGIGKNSWDGNKLAQWIHTGTGIFLDRIIDLYHFLVGEKTILDTIATLLTFLNDLIALDPDGSGPQGTIFDVLADSLNLSTLDKILSVAFWVATIVAMVMGGGAPLLIKFLPNIISFVQLVTTVARDFTDCDGDGTIYTDCHDIITPSSVSRPSRPVVSGDATTYLGMDFNINLESTHPDNSAFLEYEINWGEGDNQFVEGVKPNELVHITHAYETTGYKYIQARSRVVTADQISDWTSWSYTNYELNVKSRVKPSTPATPTGPASISKGQYYDWSFLSNHQDGNIPLVYEVNWGDGTTTQYGGNSGVYNNFEHHYDGEGTYYVKVRSRALSSDPNNGFSWTAWSPNKSVYVGNYPAPSQPVKVSGSTSVYEDMYYSWGFKSTHEFGVGIPIIIEISWGDGSVSTLSATSGNAEYKSHMYSYTGSCTISVRARVDGSTQWSSSLSFTVYISTPGGGNGGGGGYF